MAELTQLGRYKLVRVLGRGAMGVVYEGLDPALNRRVAIKTILRNAAIDEETAQAYSAQFTREAQAAGRLNHPNIVQVHDFALEGDVAYLVMEYIQGRELRSYFEAKEKFPVEESVRIMGELLDALDLAHEAGVIHRDIKPANVMLDAQRRVKLADFGVARIQDSERSAAGTMVGTPAFMSPEQIQGAKIDRRTDLFSAGVVLYQLLTGEQPFTGAGAWTVAKKIMQDDPPPPSGVVKSISPVFDGIVNRALAKSPADRYANAREFAAALRAAGGPALRAAGGPAAMPAGATLPPGQPAMAKPGAKASEAEVEFWRAIQNSSDAAEFEFYLEQFPEGTYASLARHKIAKLQEPAKEAADAGRKALEESARLEAEAREERLRKQAEAQEAARRKAEAEAEEQARIKEEAEAFAKAQAAEARARREAEERKRKEAETRARVEAEVKAQREAAESAKREAAEKAKRAAEEKARQAAALAKLKAQEAAAPKVDPDATVAISRPAPAAASAPPPEKKSFVLPAAIGAVVIAAGIGAFLLLNRKPAEAPAPVAVAPPPVAAPVTPAPPAVDEEKIRREIEERLRREFADKSAAEQAKAKVAAEKAIVEKVAAEKALAAKAAADKLQAEKMAASKSASERAALEKAAAERAAAEKLAAEKAAAEKLAAEKAAAEKAAADKLAADRAAAEKAAAEKAAPAKAAVARKPGTPLVGDRWNYEVRVPVRKQVFFIDVEALSVSPGAIREVSRTPVGGGGRPTHGPGAYLNGIGPGMAVFSPYLRAFQEIREGQSWSNIEINMNNCTNNVSVSCAASAKVVGRERVTVKAGSYDATKVVVDLNVTGMGQQGGSVEYTYWYAESVARLVKARMRVVRGMSGFPPEGDAELVSFMPADK